MNYLCLVKGLKFHSDLNNPNLKVFKITGEELTEGLALMSGYEGGPFEFTISAPSARDVQVYMDIHNMEESSTWSDCHSYLNDFEEVNGVCTDHRTWSDIMTPSRGFYNPFLDYYEETYQELFGYIPSKIQQVNQQLDELFTWEDFWVPSAT